MSKNLVHILKYVIVAYVTISLAFIFSTRTLLLEPGFATIAAMHYQPSVERDT